MKRIFLLPLIFLAWLPVHGQDSELPRKETVYSFEPHYLINRGIRVDIGKPFGVRNMIQICPQFYLSERDDDNFWQDRNQYSYLIGGGMNVYNKLFAFSNYMDYGLYLSYGVGYQFFYLEYTDYSDESEFSASGTIHKIGADLILGYQFFIHEIVSVDIYTGLGTRYSLMDADGADTNRFNTAYFGYNYTGNLLLLGVRIGVVI